MLSMKGILITAAALFFAVGCTPQATVSSVPQKEVTVAAASSMQAVLTEAGTLYEKEHPEIKLTFIFAGSGTLQNQIEEGAGVDLFISAGEKQMQALQDKGLLREGSLKLLVSNKMMVIVPKGEKAPGNLQELSDPIFKAIAAGNPESVPAGAYAKEALVSAGLFDTIQGRLVQGKDVREVLTWVETGNADVGFVYSSDINGSDKVDVAFEVDPSLHKPIVYPAAVIKDGARADEADGFLAYLAGDSAQQLFKSHGFSGTTQE